MSPLPLYAVLFQHGFISLHQNAFYFGMASCHYITPPQLRNDRQANRNFSQRRESAIADSQRGICRRRRNGPEARHGAPGPGSRRRGGVLPVGPPGPARRGPQPPPILGRHRPFQARPRPAAAGEMRRRGGTEAARRDDRRSSALRETRKIRGNFEETSRKIRGKF